MKKSLFLGSLCLYLAGQIMLINDFVENTNEENKKIYIESMNNSISKDKESNLSSKDEFKNYKNILKYYLELSEKDYNESIVKEIASFENRDILFSVYLLDIHNNKVRNFETNYYEDVKSFNDINDIYNYLLEKEGSLVTFNYYLDIATLY